MPALLTKWGAEQFGRIPYGGAPAPAASEPIYTNEQYALRVTDNNNTPIVTLHEWTSARLIKQANKPSTLEILHPIGDSKVEDALVYPNLVELYGRDGTVVDRFIIREVTESRDLRETWRIVAYSRLYQLGRDIIPSYAATELTTVQEILADWIADYQLNTTIRPVSLGALDSSIATKQVKITITNQSILAAINKLYQMIGGYFWTTADGVFRWTVATPTPSTVRTIRWNYSMGAIENRIDYGRIYTRVIGTATDSEGTALTYTANSDNQGTYGIIPYILDHPYIKSQEQLEEVADKLVDILKAPRKRTTVEAIDLSKIDSPVDLSHADLDILYPVRFVHPDSNITIATRTITRFEVDLKDPARITIDATDPDSADPDALLARLIDSDSIIDALLDDIGILYDIDDYGSDGDTIDPDNFVRRYEGSISITQAPLQANDGDRFIITSTGEVYIFKSAIGVAPGSWVPESHMEA